MICKLFICDALRNLVPFVKFKKPEKRVLLYTELQAEPCSFTKSNTPPLVFSTFFNCTNNTRFPKAFHINITVGPKIQVTQS